MMPSENRNEYFKNYMASKRNSSNKIRGVKGTVLENDSLERKRQLANARNRRAYAKRTGRVATASTSSIDLFAGIPTDKADQTRRTHQINSTDRDRENKKAVNDKQNRQRQT